jgi:hypothetical protein
MPEGICAEGNGESDANGLGATAKSPNYSFSLLHNQPYVTYRVPSIDNCESHDQYCPPAVVSDWR